MHAQCTICGDTFTGTHPEVVHSTPCGHLFHYVCLIEWLQRSQTCPQCRARVIENKTIKIYFQVSTNTFATEDSGMLENEVQNLKFELKMKDMDVAALKKEKDLAKDQANELRQKVKKREERIRNHEAVVDNLEQQIATLKQEIKMLKEFQFETYELRNKIESLQTELDNLGSIKRIIEGSASEATEQLSRNKDPAALSFCIQSLKKQIETDKQKVRHLNSELKRTEHRLSNVTAEVDKLRSENIILNRAFDIQSAANPRKRLAPNKREELNDDSITMIDKCDETESTNHDSSLEIIQIDSPKRKICSNGSSISIKNRIPRSPTSPFSSRRLISTKSKSLLNKRESPIKSSSNQMPLCYDGLGGHFREEITFSDRATLLRDIGSDRSNKLKLPKKTKTSSNTKKTATHNSGLLRFYSRKTDSI